VTACKGTRPLALGTPLHHETHKSPNRTINSIYNSLWRYLLFSSTATHYLQQINGTVSKGQIRLERGALHLTRTSLNLGVPSIKQLGATGFADLVPYSELLGFRTLFRTRSHWVCGLGSVLRATVFADLVPYSEPLCLRIGSVLRATGFADWFRTQSHWVCGLGSVLRATGFADLVPYSEPLGLLIGSSSGILK
jgi:hypothetical protein